MSLFFFVKNVLGIDLANNLSAMIYDKVLRYPILSDKAFSKSKIQNLFQTDINNIKYVFFPIFMTLSTILQAIVTLVILYAYFDF